MSKDIRSFFKPNNCKNSSSKTPVTRPKVLSDDDEIPESPEPSILQNIKERHKRKRVFDDSSDEEILLKKEKPKEKKTIKAKKVKQKPDKALKEVAASDIFGSGPIKRTEIPKIPKRKVKTETEIHSDDDFDKTLLQLDEEAIIDDSTPDEKGKVNSVNLTEEEEQENNNKQVNEKERVHKKADQRNHDKVKKSKHYDSNEQKSRLDEKKVSQGDLTEQNSKHGREKDKSSKISPHKLKDTKTAKKIEANKTPTKEHRESTKDEVAPKSNSKLQAAKTKSPNKPDTIEKKRDFSEFISADCDDKSADTPSNKKRKQEQSFNESVLSDEERHERKRHTAVLYQKFLNRSGPQNLGAKELPQGAPNCFKDTAFLLTGVLDSFEREEIADAIKSYGGVIKSGVTKKVNYIIAGDDAGPAKLAKAEDLKIPILNEDEFIDLIKKCSGIKSDLKSNDNKKQEIEIKSEPKDKNKSQTSDEMKESSSKENSPKSKSLPSKLNKTPTSDVKKVKPVSFYGKKKELSDDEIKKEVKVEEERNFTETSEVQNKTDEIENKKDERIGFESMMWVEKYKPQSVKQIVGQHGDASNVKKLMKWLSSWYENRKRQISKPSPWAKNDDGSYYRAALLSGPPGIGKTTTVSLVCKELGFDAVEFNASDTRSKSLLKEHIQEMLSTNSLIGYVTGKRAITKKKVLVMDEVDGMAGNEDRGGLQELISLIKTSPVPVICMCNDRNSTKMRSFVNYCYDLRFTRPRLDQIKSFLLSVCFREGVKVPPDVLVQIITTANQDIRQSLTLLSLYAGAQLSSKAKKDVKMGPWEAIRKVFTKSEHKTMSLHDKGDLFFSDYSIMPLFVAENYINVKPDCPNKEVLSRLAMAAESISYGDLIENKIRGRGAWALLPTQAIMSSVIPGAAMAGQITAQIQFPSWLGKNSRAGKLQRLATLVHAHTRLSASGSKESILLDYSGYILRAIAAPLSQEGTQGVEQALEVMKSYHLLRDDLEAMTEMAVWPGRKDPMQAVESKVKAALTRAVNKESGSLPYAQVNFKKLAQSSSSANPEEFLDETEGAEEESEGSDTEQDAMIKKNTKSSTSQPKKEKSKSEAKPSKGKGKGKKS